MAGEGRPVLAVPGRSDRRLSRALRVQVPSGVPPGPAGLLGLELEFSVRSAGGGRVHFGSLIHRLALNGTALDPGDPNAYRCSWGGVITADGAEAEIATPPVRARPGFAARLEAWAHTGEAELRRAVPCGIELDGYSTHLSAAMPAKLNDRVCRLYAGTFAADLMLLMDRADSPGLLVRPRPGRTELCGEFLENEPLAAAAAFVAGSTRACAAAVRGRSGRTALPPRLDVQLARAVHRYGWYVDRGAFGMDLHSASRRTLLRRASGGTICAQSHLELAWAVAREALADDAAAADLQAAEAMVTGSLPLPAEQGQPDDAPIGQRGGDVPFPLDGAVVPDMPCLSAHVRPGFTLRPVAATWDFTVFEARGPARSAYACIPRDSLPGFAAALEEGALDDAIAAYLALTSRRRVLSAAQQTTSPGLYDRMDAPTELLAPERDPQTGHQESRESRESRAKRMLARPGKRDRQEQRSSPEPKAPRKAAWPVRRAVAIGVVIAVVLAGSIVAAAVLSRGHSGPNGKPAAVVSMEPSALVFPAVRVNTSITRSFTMTDNGNSPATITGVRISGPNRHDFSVRRRAFLDAARRGGQVVHPAAQPPCHRRVPHRQTCTVTVTFAPLAAGPDTAYLRISLASHRQPRDIALRGMGTISAPPPSSSVSVTGVSPASGTTKGGTSVTITGTGFTAPPAGTGVSFGGAAAQFTIDSGTRITATSPPGSGTVPITVTTPAGTSAATAADQFRYTQTVTKTATTTTTAVTSSANPATTGQAVTFTATVRAKSPGSGTPTGKVTFSDGSSQLGTAKLGINGTAEFTTSALAAGSHAIAASYGGDQNFTGSTGSLTQTVTQTTTTTVSSSANPSVVKQEVTYTATVSPVPDGGTVTFSDDGSSIPGCVQVNLSTGTATCPVTYPSTGQHMIEATYSGDTAFLTSTGPLTQAVTKATTTITVSSSGNLSGPGQVTYKATVSPVPDGGMVTFSDDGAAIFRCRAEVNSSISTATCQVGYKIVAAHSIEAFFSGDTAFGASAGSLPQTATTTTVSSSANPSKVGQPVAFMATISPVPVGGTVRFSDDGTPIPGCLQVPASTGTAICQATYPSTGQHMIEAAYSGDIAIQASVGSLTQIVQ
jgi:Bacterial Ig-like domain (group 3)/IPT/TIG domain